jgi:ElaB/YqjD/DUF883 family membrane-anchored ribosome-binding protein
MATASERLSKAKKEVKEGLRDLGETDKDAVQRKLRQMGEAASGYCAQGKAQVHGVACACEQFIRNRPLSSVLMAAGLGYVIGRIWKRD